MPARRPGSRPAAGSWWHSRRTWPPGCSTTRHRRCCCAWARRCQAVSSRKVCPAAKRCTCVCRCCWSRPRPAPGCMSVAMKAFSGTSTAWRGRPACSVTRSSCSNAAHGAACIACTAGISRTSATKASAPVASAGSGCSCANISPSALAPTWACASTRTTPCAGGAAMSAMIEVQVTEVRQLTPVVREFSFRAVDGTLPGFSCGSHVQVILPTGGARCAMPIRCWATRATVVCTASPCACRRPRVAVRATCTSRSGWAIVCRSARQATCSPCIRRPAITFWWPVASASPLHGLSG